jgi:hypothetical protein
MVTVTKIYAQFLSAVFPKTIDSMVPGGGLEPPRPFMVCGF